MALENPVVDVASTSDEVRKEVFNVQYTDDRCKQYAIDVLNVIGFVAENNKEGSGQRDRSVTVHVTKAQLGTATEILKIFASNVRKVTRTSKFKITFKNKTKQLQEFSLGEVKELKGVDSADFIDNNVPVRDKNASNVTQHSHVTLTLKVVGDVDPKDVLKILNKHGRACISS